MPPRVSRERIDPAWLAIMGGLIFTTILTLLFLPALHAARFPLEKPAASIVLVSAQSYPDHPG